MIEQIEAKNAKRAIRKMLMGNGGSVILTVGNSIRILSQSAIDRPRFTLPWPLKLTQFRTIRYRVYEGVRIVEEETFDRRSINTAISKLLVDVPFDEKILIRRD